MITSFVSCLVEKKDSRKKNCYMKNTNVCENCKFVYNQAGGNLTIIYGITIKVYKKSSMSVLEDRSMNED